MIQDEDGFRSLVQRLTKLRPNLIVMEASCGYERLVLTALATAQLPVTVVSSHQVRDFDHSQGIVAKTGRLDAVAIAHFGEVSGAVAQP